MIAASLALAVAAALQQPAAPTAERARPDQVRVVRDLRYAETEGVAARFQSLDLYAPKTPGPHPVLVMIHGGGWSLGDKANRSMWRDKVPHFVGAGWVYCSINYRLTERGGQPAHPAHVEDVAAALAWVHEQVATYGGDPDRLFVMGHSAGAHLAALVATDARRLGAHGKALSILKGVVCLDTAGYDIARYLGEMQPRRAARALYQNAFGSEPAGWQDASPAHHVAAGQGIPPMLLLHTSGRREVAALSRAMVSRLEAAAVPAKALYAHDRDHGAINACIGQPGDPYTAAIMQFLAAPTEVAAVRLAPQPRTSR